MTFDEAGAHRLIAFCRHLPAIGGEPTQARAETYFVLDCFERRRQELHAQAAHSGDAGPERAALRCELEALGAATDAVLKIWQRRFGTALDVAP
jgi:hypothetical protein